MPSYYRPSSRAIIQDWLSHTDVGPNAEKHAYSSKKKCASRGRHHRHPHRNGAGARVPANQKIESRGCGKSSRDAGEHLSRAHDMSQQDFCQTAPLENETYSLAQRLGLRTPFRVLGVNQVALKAKDDGSIRGVKRKRTLSSSGLSLRRRTKQPALAGADGCENIKSPRPAKSNEVTSKPLSPICRSSRLAPKTVKTNAKSYERKSRRKTREDHYTLKQAPKVRKHRVDEGEQGGGTRGKRKRGDKSGSALMHDFNARNVAYDRLTLRSAPAVGIFSKGRASSPIKRMGLPDLAFSEVAFLKSRREKPENLHEPLEGNSRRRKEKYIDNDDEISRYFTSTKPSVLQRQDPNPQPLASLDQLRLGSQSQRVQANQEKQSVKSNAVLPQLELPATPFLGFGSSGLSMSSPMKLHNHLNTSNRNSDESDHLVSPTRSTSYYTWSGSGTSPQASLHMQSDSKPQHRSRRNQECQTNHQQVGEVTRHQDSRTKHAQGEDNTPCQPDPGILGVKLQARALHTESRSGQALPSLDVDAGFAELSNEKERAGGGKLFEEAVIRNGSMNNSPKTPLAANPPSTATDRSSFPNDHCPDAMIPHNTVSATFGRHARQCTESPSRRTGNSLHTTIVPCGAGPSNFDKFSVAANSMRGFERQDSDINVANSASGLASPFPLFTPISRASQMLYSRAEASLKHSSSTSTLGRSPRFHGHGDHQVPVMKNCGMQRSEISVKNAWHAYDNMYERQDTHRYNFSNGSISQMREHIPAGSLHSGEFKALEEYTTNPSDDCIAYSCREKINFQRSQENNLAFGSPFNRLPDTSPRSLAHRTSPSHGLFGNEIEQGNSQTFAKYIENDEVAFEEKATSGAGRKCSPHHPMDILEKNRNDVKQAYSRAELGEVKTPLLRTQAAAYSARSSFGFAMTPRLARSEQDGEGHFAGFWKPHLLY